MILAIGSAGIQLSQGTGQSTNGYNAQQIGAAAIGQQFGELGQEYARSGLAIPNTLRIRNGYNFITSRCRSRKTWCYGPIWIADRRRCCRLTLGLSCNEWAWSCPTGQRPFHRVRH
jgi:hypothetical protein